MGDIVSCNLISSSVSWFEKSNAKYEKKVPNDSLKVGEKRIKTVYLIRHAESNENKRLASLERALNQIIKLKLPLKDDVTNAFELLNFYKEQDSRVSSKGKKQIEQLRYKLQKDDFILSNKIQLIAHSPLIRARQTCEGMLESVTSRNASNIESFWEGKKAKGVGRVVELDSLIEQSPIEWLPINRHKFLKRIQEFEMWLQEQPEERIAIVGHSNYFRSMLNLPYKFDNCDVWEIKYIPIKQCFESFVDVNGDKIHVVQEKSNKEFEMIHDDDYYSTEDDLKTLGWSGLINRYRYEENYTF